MGTKAKIGLLVSLAAVVVSVVIWDKMTLSKAPDTLASTPENGTPETFDTPLDTASLPPADDPDGSTTDPMNGNALPAETANNTQIMDTANPFAATTPNPLMPPVSVAPTAVVPPALATPTPAVSTPPAPIQPPTFPTELGTPAGTGDVEVAATASARTYKVQAGDSLWVISKHEYGDGSKWKKILEANRTILRDESSRLHEGMEIRIPAVENHEAPRGTEAQKDAVDEGTYTVRAGDSFSSIAAHFYGDANRWKPVFEANRAEVKDPTRLRVGMRLTIPKSDTATAAVTEMPAEVASADGSTYVVKPGDTLGRIAKKFFNSEKAWKRIFEANQAKLKNPHSLSVGQVLLIPSAPEAAAIR